MTPTQIKIAAAAAGLAIAWLFSRPRAPSGSVDLGIPTIDGIFGGGRLGNGVDYYSTPAPTPDNPAVDPTMRGLIDRSNRLIANDDAEEIL